MTPLDAAHRNMLDNPEDASARLAFFERLCDGEIFLMLEEEPKDDTIKPDIFEVEQGPLVLVFDSEERLSSFTQKVTPFVGLSGRTLVKMLAGKGIGLGINLDVAPSSMMLDSADIDWLAKTLEVNVQQTQAGIKSIAPPQHIPEVLLTSLDTKLATMVGLAQTAYLAKFEYISGEESHVLAFLGALDGAQDAITTAISEALTFSGIDAGMLDVVFLEQENPAIASLQNVGLRFDLPDPMTTRVANLPPGSDPNSPPKLH